MISVTIALSIFSVVFAAVSLFTTMRRNNKKDDGEEASRSATIISKLENIGDDVKDVKSDIREMRNDLRDHTARIIVLEQKIERLNESVFGNKNS